MSVCVVVAGDWWCWWWWLWWASSQLPTLLNQLTVLDHFHRQQKYSAEEAGAAWLDVFILRQHGITQLTERISKRVTDFHCTIATLTNVVCYTHTHTHTHTHTLLDKSTQLWNVLELQCMLWLDISTLTTRYTNQHVTALNEAINSNKGHPHLKTALLITGDRKEYC